MAEFIYTMKKVRKAHGDKVILDDVTLSFYPGAKIGVVGPNGAGKSSVLRIMAGLDKPNNGDAFLANDATVGILLQEPPLNEEKTVRGNVEEGLGEIKVKLDRFNEVAELKRSSFTLISPRPSSTLPRTVFSSFNGGSCCRMPTVAPVARNASPLFALSSPAMIRKTLDLPAPLGPTTPILAPG